MCERAGKYCSLVAESLQPPRALPAQVMQIALETDGTGFAPIMYTLVFIGPALLNQMNPCSAASLDVKREWRGEDRRMSATPVKSKTTKTLINAVHRISNSPDLDEVMETIFVSAKVGGPGDDLTVSIIKIR